MAPEKKRRWLWGGMTLIALLVGLLLLLASLRGTPLAEIWETLRGLRGWQVGILLLVNAAILSLFTLRWWLLLRAVGSRTAFHRLFGYRLAAFGVNYFTPGPQFGGEPVQVALLTGRGALNTAAAAASVTLDKLLEFAFNLGFLVCGFFLVLARGIMPDLARPEIASALVLLLGLPLVYLGLLWRGRRPITCLAQRASRHRFKHVAIQKARRFVYASEKQMTILFQGKPLVFLGASLASTGAWLFMALEFWLSMNFLGMSANLLTALITLTAARLAFLAPTPAGLGALEGALTLAAVAQGYDPASGLALSLYIRARDILVGFAGLGILAWSFQRSRSQRVQHGMITNPAATESIPVEHHTQPAPGVGPHG